MKLKRIIGFSILLAVIVPMMAFAHNITVDGSDVSHKIKLAGAAYDYMPEGESATYDLDVGTYRIYSSGGGYIPSFDVGSSGEVSYDSSYHGTVFVGTGTSTITVVGHEITIDGTQVDTKVYEQRLGHIGTTQPDGTVTYKLPANVERRQTPGLDEYVVFSWPGGKIAHFNVTVDGTIYFDPMYDGIITGTGTSTVTVPGHEITIDGTQVDTEIYEYSLRSIDTTKTDGQATYRFPANPYYNYGGGWGPYAIQSLPGGRLANFYLEPDGTIAYDEIYNGIFTVTGSTINIVGHEISIDGTQVDTEIYEYSLRSIDTTKTDGQATYRFPANPYYNVGGGWGPYALISSPGGRVIVFHLEVGGTVAYDAEYNGVVSVAGSIVTVIGYDITINATDISNDYMWIYGLSQNVSGGSIGTYRLPATPNHGSWGPFRLLSSPGGSVAVFKVMPYGSVSYDSAYEGAVTGTGTTALNVVGYDITIDATDVTTDYIWIHGLSENVYSGTMATFRLPANPYSTNWAFGPYYLKSTEVSGNRIINGDFIIYIGGSCSKSEISYDHGTIQLHSGIYNPDPEPPITNSVVANPNPAEFKNDINLMATVDDSETGGSDIISAEYRINGGDWVPMDGAFNLPTVQVSATIPSSVFPLPEVYEICVRGTDGAENIGLQECTCIAIYDPDGGFVTGGGWIMSLAGAYLEDPSLEGKASFGFVSKYKKGANLPTGNTQFQFKTGGFNFHSYEYDWLVVPGNHTAKYKGTGTINGLGSYKFMIWAQDKEYDTFRIKIWDEDEEENEFVIYDNGFDQEIGGGNIKVHEGY